MLLNNNEQFHRASKKNEIVRLFPEVYVGLVQKLHYLIHMCRQEAAVVAAT
jgi:hypothetical protein